MTGMDKEEAASVMRRLASGSIWVTYSGRVLANGQDGPRIGVYRMSPEVYFVGFLEKAVDRSIQPAFGAHGMRGQLFGRSFYPLNSIGSVDAMDYLFDCAESKGRACRGAAW